MSIGVWQLLLILAIILIIFGAGKLPKVMGDLGKGVRSLKEGMQDDEADKDKEKDPKKELPEE